MFGSYITGVLKPKLKTTKIKRTKKDFCQAVSAIAEFNKKHFFSDKFLDIVRNELENNLDSVWETVANTQGKHYLEFFIY